ncbi:MAG: 50S ribosomal protein L32e [Candidatus Nanohaloarchaea archaeon]|nr:50S ribosomal protein L32e [Candidatus Nanohaloarchaea archaeon]
MAEKSPEELKKKIEKNRGDKEFKRQNSHKHNRVEDSWRKPRGTHSRSRLGKKYGKPTPGSGQRSPKDIRGVHPSGYEDILVHRPEELDEIDPDTEAIRIASKVGGRKREDILDKAEDMDIKVLNAEREPDETEGSEEDE